MNLSRITILLKLVLLLALAKGCKSDIEAKNGSYRSQVVELSKKKTMTKALKRDEIVEKLKNTKFDMIVIGGGSTGAGIALDASTRGLKVALVEKGDFSSQTSSKSTKLVHGGIRYLEDAFWHLDYKKYKLVTEALAERKFFLKNLRHISSPMPIVTPVYSWSDAMYYLLGLKVYDMLSHEGSIGKSLFITKEEMVKRFPTIKQEKLVGGIQFFDGKFDDARANISIVLTAIREGALPINYAEVTDLIKEDRKIVGVKVTDTLLGQSFNIFGKSVINATGPFADHIRGMENIPIRNLIKASKGSHIVFNKTISHDGSGLILPKTKDGRIIFLLPWQNYTLLGTTDVETDITYDPKASEEEADFILEHASKYLNMQLNKKDITSSFSGIRPLVKSDEETNTKDLSREHYIERSLGGLITIVGGKWTTFRAMSEELVDYAIKNSQLIPKNPSTTKDIYFVGAKYYKDSLAEELVNFENLDADIALHLAQSYGDRVDMVIDIDGKSQRSRLHDSYPFIKAEVIYCIREEYVQKPVDFLARRIRLAFLDVNAALEILPVIAKLMQKELGWSDDRLAQEIKDAKKELELFLTGHSETW